MKKDLAISELFYSVQCEGYTTGVPAYFMRLFNCNLNCGVTSKTLQEIRKVVLASGYEAPELKDLMVAENATWVCDTIPVWVQRKRTSFQEVTDKWKEEGVYDDILSGNINLIWTGGEPTLKANQDAIVDFLVWLENEEVKGGVSDTNIYSEVETNGTQYIESDLFNLLDQINCSAKLSNSGHTKEQRIVPDAIKRIMFHQNYWFKFVVSTEKDIEELFYDYVIPFNIPRKRIIIMPGLSKQEFFHERTNFILEMAKKHGIRACQRLHISAYDQVTGV